MEKAVGFVLKSLKYGDTSLILHVYTRESGMQSLIIKGFFSSKNHRLRPLQFPFSKIEYSFRNQPKTNLILPQQLQLDNGFVQLYQHPVKMLMLQFLCEILYLILREDEANASIFDFIEKELIQFNQKTVDYAEFHLIFLVQLTRSLGFDPNRENDDLPYFDLSEGKFTNISNAQYTINEIDTNNWRKLLNAEFSENYKNQFSQAQRQQLLDIILLYLSLHMPGFKEPKSLVILKELIQ